MRETLGSSVHMLKKGENLYTAICHGQDPSFFSKGDVAFCLSGPVVRSLGAYLSTILYHTLRPDSVISPRKL